MAETMRLWNTYLGPASDSLLDLGEASFRWNNIFLKGVNSSTTISSSSVNTTILISNSAHVVGYSGTGATISSGNISNLRFIKEVGSSLTLSNSANAYLNVKMLTHNAASILSGDVYFFASSNRVYLAISSQSATYYIAMNT
jgi:hypothetical protein